MTEETGLDGGPWPSPVGSGSRISPVPLSGRGKERWRVALNSRRVSGVSVAANGMCFVTSESGIRALDGEAVRWERPDIAYLGCLLLSGERLVTIEEAGLVVREQRTGATVSVLETTAHSAPVPVGDGLLAFLASRAGETVLRATTLTGDVRWEAPVDALLQRPVVRHGQVVVTDGMLVRAFDWSGSPLWSASRHGFGVPDRQPESAEVDGPLVGLADDKVLVPIRADDVMGYLVVDPRRGEVRPVPAHLRPGAPVVPRRDPATGRELIVLPGWPETDAHDNSIPTVTVVDIDSGAVVLRHRVPAEPRGMVAGPTGLVAVAGSPSWEYWAKYQGWPGFELRDDCYVLFLDEDGVRTEWKAGKPITGPLAVGPDGDVLVVVSGELVSLE